MKRLAALLKIYVRIAFGVAGGGNSLELITALEQEGILYIPVVNESAAAIMAGAYSCRGIPEAVAISIKGPGFSNMIPALALNYYEERPALTISEAYANTASPVLQHKRMSHFAVGNALMWRYYDLPTFISGGDLLNQLSLESTIGPIHLDLAETGCTINQPIVTAPYEDIMSVSEVIQLINMSKRTTVILGSLAKRFSSLYNWNEITLPIMTTASAKGIVDESGSFHSGVITGEVKTLSPENLILKDSDLIIAIGLRNNEIIRPFDIQSRIVLIDTEHEKLASGFLNSEKCVCRIDELGEIANALKTKDWGQNEIKAAKKLVNEALNLDEWLPAIVFKTVQSNLPKNTILVLDTGLFCTIGEIAWEVHSPDLFLGSSNSRYMGTSIPTAIGRSFLTPDVPLICVFGDGGVGSYLAEVNIAVQWKLPIVFMLMSDGCYGTVDISAEMKDITSKATQIGQENWNDVYSAIGCSSYRIRTINELNECLSAWCLKDGPMFIRLDFERIKYRKMTDLLR